MSTTQQTTDVDVPEAGDHGGIGQAISDYFTRVKGGDVGSLPAVLGLIVLFVFFSLMKPETFFTTFNFANLLNQSTAIIVLAMGLVFVLLLGEIDLSAGFTAGTAAAVLAVAIASWGMPWPVALVLGLLTGTVIGLLIGLLVARLGIPSFVVTLAMFLALQGVMLLIIGEGGTIRLRSDELLAIMNKNMPLWAGWLLWAVVILGYAVRLVAGDQRPPQGRAQVDGDVGVGGQDRRPGRAARAAWCSCSTSSARSSVRARSRCSGRRRGPAGLHPRHPGRAVGRAGRAGAARRAHLRARAGPRSAGTSTRSAATPRRRAAPASASR